MNKYRIAKSIKNRFNSLYDKRHRSPRNLGFVVDDGIPDRGRRYGGAQTIHNTGTIDVVLNDKGEVSQVWFRCQMLAFRVSDFRRNETVQGDKLVAVEVVSDE